MKTKSNKCFYFLSNFNSASFNNYLFSFIFKAKFFFHLVEHDSFCKLLLFCWSNMQISHQIFLKITLIKWYIVMQKKLLYDLSLSYKLLLVLNCWTSSNNYAFLVITDYFITNDWNYVKILLIFKSLSDMHSEEKLANYVMKTLHFHNITKQFLIIMTDNAKNNDLLYQKFHKVLKKKYSVRLLIRNNLLHVTYISILCQQVQ